jgi:predicted GH43/DUF377 family glycosyl hydrolase
VFFVIEASQARLIPRRRFVAACAFGLFIASIAVAQPNEPSALPADELQPVAVRQPGKRVPDSEMQRVFGEVKTPFKYGIVLRPGEKESLDCPNVFRHGGTWYMVYVAITEKVGYQTFLAQSDDLLVWKPLGPILPFAEAGWDQWQAAGSIALADHTWGGGSELGQHDGKYWLSYFGGDKQGYEPDPLSIGLAWTTTPDQPSPWHRVADNPVLSPGQADAREFEKATLYKSSVIWDKSKSLGHPFAMFYNAKQQGPWIERIGIAVSDDMLHWRRYGTGPVIDNGRGISGDPQIVRMGDLWTMFYFGAGWKPNAFDTFACSYDLVKWTKWTGPDLISPSEPWDETFAHKPWLIKHNGVVYHFYCAVGAEGRAIALATSKDFGAASEKGEPAAAQRRLETNDTEYIFTSFRGNGEDGLRFLRSNDGFRWHEVPGAFLKPKVGSQRLMRDPSIAVGPDGMFHLVWTTGWQHDRGFGYASSKDLVKWSQQRFIPVMEHEPTTVNVWAPELFYDEPNERFIIIWASTIPGRFPDHLEPHDNNQRMYYTTTRDFQTFTPTKLFFDPDFSVIDCTIVPADDKYVLVLKDNTRPQRNLRVAFADSPLGPWREVSDPFTQHFTEGPTVLKVNEDWIIYFDAYQEEIYGAVKTRDFKSFTDITKQVHVPKGHKHGTVLPLHGRKLASAFTSSQSN